MQIKLRNSLKCVHIGRDTFTVPVSLIAIQVLRSAEDHWPVGIVIASRLALNIRPVCIVDRTYTSASPHRYVPTTERHTLVVVFRAIFVIKEDTRYLPPFLVLTNWFGGIWTLVVCGAVTFLSSRTQPQWVSGRLFRVHSYSSII